MTTSTLQPWDSVAERREEAKQLLDEASAIAKAADDAHRNFTNDERLKVRDLINRAKELKALADQVSDDRAFRAAHSILGGDLDGGSFVGTRSAKAGAWARAARHHLGTSGRKELAPSGTLQVPSISSTIATNADRPRSILQVIPFVPEGGELFAFLQEVERTHNAAPVAAGTLKPTSTYSLEKVSDRVRTIAHLTDPIDRSLLSDVPLVEAYLAGALRDGCELALEDEVLNGDGTGEHLAGIFNTSGIQVQAFATDVLTSLRKAITKLENQNLDPAGFAVALSPGRWEAIELTKDSDQYVMGGASGPTERFMPVNRSARQVWGIPAIVTTAITDDDVALLGDFRGSARIHEREGVVIEWSEATQVAIAGDSGGATASAFEVNKRVFRGELRAGLEVSRPAAFVEVALA